MPKPPANDQTPKPRLGKPGTRRKPRSLKSHIIRRLVMAGLAGLLIVVMHEFGLLDRVTDRIQYEKDRSTFTDLSWFNTTDLNVHLKQLVSHNGLTDRPARCLLTIENTIDHENNAPPSPYAQQPMTNTVLVDVMAYYQPPGCGDGTHKAADKLFSLRVDRAAHTIETDAGTPGQFRMIASR